MQTMTNNQTKELGSFSSYKEVLNFVPRSVWDINSRSKEIKEIFDDDLEKHTCKRTTDGYAVKIKQKFSVFNPTLGMNILKIWSNVGDQVLDPFAGRDRALITNYSDRHYTGFEISPATFNQLQAKVENWKYRNDQYEINLFNGNGINLNTIACHDNFYDFAFSCPPYWDKEKYESVSGQLSDIKSEPEWRRFIAILAFNLSKKLKSGKFAAFVIADIRKKGELIPLSSHFIEEFRKSGRWKLKDVVINKTNPMNCSGINGYLRNRIMWKTHEYVLVFKNN
jgi:DNA modification methylase